MEIVKKVLRSNYLWAAAGIAVIILVAEFFSQTVLGYEPEDMFAPWVYMMAGFCIGRLK